MEKSEEKKKWKNEEGMMEITFFDSPDVKNAIASLQQVQSTQVKDIFEASDDIIEDATYDKIVLGVDIQKKYRLSENKVQELYEQFSKSNKKILTSDSQDSMENFIDFKNYFKSYLLEFWNNKEQINRGDLSRILWKMIQQELVSNTITKKEIAIWTNERAFYYDNNNYDMLLKICQNIINLHNEIEKLDVSQVLEKETLVNVKLVLQQIHQDKLKKLQHYFLVKYKMKWKDVMNSNDHSFIEDTTDMIKNTVHVTEALEIFEKMDSERL